MSKKGVTRRDFLRTAALAPLAGAFVYGFKPGANKDVSRKARVVLIRDEKALVSFKKPDPDIVQAMLDEAVARLFGEKDPVKAWKQVVMPSDVVGIKSNVWRPIPTTDEVEEAIKRRVMDAGVPEGRIGIDDRGVRNNPIFQEATVLINARPGRTHHWSGMGTCIKNHIMFVPRPYEYHADSCADLATIWNDYGLKAKTTLNILVMLYPLFHGIGPHHYSDSYVWEYKGLLVGEDPVAVDTIGLRIIDTQRRRFFGQDRPLQPPAKHIFLADTRHGLGVSNPEEIELIKLGWQEGALV